MNKYSVMKLISKFAFVVIVFLGLFFLLIKFNIITLDSSKLPLAIVLNHDEIGLKLESSYQLEAEIFPKNVSYGEIKWISTNPSVVSVNETTGYIETHKVGTATIKAKVALNNLETECVVNVSKNDILVKNIKVNNEEINLLKGDSYKIGYSLMPLNATTHNFDYISSDNSVVVVNDKGVIKAVNSGKAIVTVKSRINNVSDSIVVNVYNYSSNTLNNNYLNNELISKSKKIVLSNTLVELGVGVVSKLNSIVMPVNASQKINWVSTNTNVVIVSNDGSIIGVNEGRAKVVATTIDGISTVCEVIVSKNNKIKGIVDIVDTNISVNVGEVRTINYNLYLSSTNSSTIKWTSSDEFVLTVKNGVINGLSKGEAIVKVSSENGKFSDMVKVKVVENPNNVVPENIMFTSNLINAKVNDTINLIPNISPVNANNYILSWTSSDEKIAIVEQGVVKCLKEGKVTITVQSNDISANVLIIIGAVHPSLISIEGDNYVNLQVGATKYLIKKIIPSNATNQNVTWLSSNSSIVSVSDDGLIKGINKGSAIITVKTTNDKSYSVNVLVS